MRVKIKTWEEMLNMAGSFIDDGDIMSFSVIIKKVKILK
jgi:hypothetical protein